MTIEIDEALHQSFRAALVLAGSIEDAERAVTNAIDMLESDLSADALLAATARSAFQSSTFSEELSSFLPLELQALFLLLPTPRHCFVLRILLRIDLETCSEILRLSEDEIQEALYQSLLRLPRAVEFIRPAGRTPCPRVGPAIALKPHWE